MTPPLPAKEQVDAVAAQLKNLKPGFDGKLTHTIDKDGVATDLHFSTYNVRSILPLRALTALRVLTCVGTNGNDGDLADLSPLVHSILLGDEVPIVEHVCGLSHLPEERFRFFAVPVKVKGMGTFPVRKYGLIEEIQ